MKQNTGHLLASSVFISVFLLTPALCTSFPTPSSSPTGSIDILLNCSATNGIIHQYGEINDGPAPVQNASSYADLTTQYQDIGITAIRTHDLSGPTDIHTIFPNLSANPTNASNYHFETSDPFITSMINAGCQVYYRLGESAGNNDTLKEPPGNFTTWAEVCKHITMHYNDGWDNGYHYNIRYWEVWNEPDILGFWTGTATQYYQLYQTASETLKAYNASLKVGGPCTSSVTNTVYTEGFLQYLSNHSVPLDFFSWHLYASAPSEYYNASRHVRTLLDQYGYTDAENINSEWNYNILSPQRDKDNAMNAAFTACSMTVFQDSHLDQAYRYRGTQDNNWLSRFLGLDLSLFTYKGVYKRPALTYLTMKALARDTPLRLLTPPMNGSTGTTYLAGVSADGTNVTVMLSNFNTKDAAYTLQITDLPRDTGYTVVHYLIDDTHHFEIISTSTENTSVFATESTLKSNTVELYRLTTSKVIPAEGPAVARIPLLLRLHVLDPFTRLLSILLILLVLG